VKVAVPTSLSKSQKANLEKFIDSLPSENPREELIKKAKR